MITGWNGKCEDAPQQILIVLTLCALVWAFGGQDRPELTCASSRMVYGICANVSDEMRSVQTFLSVNYIPDNFPTIRYSADLLDRSSFAVLNVTLISLGCLGAVPDLWL